MTNTELAILSLIAEQPRHGYEIEQVIEARGMRQWTEIGFSSIYFLLKKLEKDGLIEGRTEQTEGRGPARKIFHLTQAGAEAFQSALFEALAKPQPCYSSFLLGVGNLPGLSPDQATTALRQYHQALTDQLAQIQTRWTEQQPLPYFVDALFDYSMTKIEAELTWIEKFIKQVEAEMTKLDFKKELKHLYQPSAKKFEVVDVPPMQYLMIDGRGDPNTAPEYQEAVEALFAVAYALKFMSKKGKGLDYVVPPLEGLWWAEDMAAFSSGNKDQWLWTVMVMQPEWITPAMFEQAVRQVKKKKELPALAKIRLETYHEGLSVQILHLGSYTDEAPTIAKMHREFMPENGYEPVGKHHEIYLSDPRRVAPEKLKTVLRQPVKKI
ncbi:MAG: GyrI-like domain-containing protein [Anaerolineae bacterium]|nr:GyrI-like domain-containing protein [Anaerolineae bacterium]